MILFFSIILIAAILVAICRKRPGLALQTVFWTAFIICISPLLFFGLVFGWAIWSEVPRPVGGPAQLMTTDDEGTIRTKLIRTIPGNLSLAEASDLLSRSHFKVTYRDVLERSLTPADTDFPKAVATLSAFQKINYGFGKYLTAEFTIREGHIVRMASVDIRCPMP